MAHDVINCPNCGKPVVLPEVPMPTGLGDLCSRFPQLCAEVKELKAQTTALVRAANEHPKPTAEFIQSTWKDCPECSVAFERLLTKHPELFQPKEPKKEPKEEDRWAFLSREGA